jgi:hypothetical protein
METKVNESGNEIVSTLKLRPFPEKFDGGRKRAVEFLRKFRGIFWSSNVSTSPLSEALNERQTKPGIFPQKTVLVR